MNTNSTKNLYAAAIELYTPNGMRPDFRYFHIPENEDLRYAEASFRRAHSNEICSGRMRVVSIARAIGFHALDDNGDLAVA